MLRHWKVFRSFIVSARNLLVLGCVVALAVCRASQSKRIAKNANCVSVIASKAKQTQPTTRLFCPSLHDLANASYHFEAKKTAGKDIKRGIEPVTPKVEHELASSTKHLLNLGVTPDWIIG
jgi:hypothetical protein